MLVFLDIDGVLVHDGCKAYRDIDPNCVMVLREFCRKYDASIVVSSTWRITRTIDELDFTLFSYGMDRGTVIGATGHDSKGHRGREILEWMRKCAYPDEREYVVIDDEIVDITDVIHPVNVIHVDNGWRRGGLNQGHVEDWERRNGR